ncbi:hypothetical protein EXE51_06570 [Halorubrum sp. CGM5_25_10-8B]|uniref:Uncharacterized protein n=1 Tax=Halorubrum distributum TaxID=29283 RepID=A0A6B1INY3_9EURY|nr:MULTISPECIES: hypothetical protein [Halorubrum]MYL16815.1 hypothetical protein [Halorubrum terrestre]TKX37740.1 hypothetical protein EXE51_06570 [Halorubrum sp. CGM5_25_10-8B]
MSDYPIGTPVIDDNRAVSTVIGVVILFGFLILALSLYQVEIVPQQNAETEFQHSGEVRNDLVELRAGILQAGSIDQPQYQTVELGTTYSTRVFTINPPPPAGTIRTTESYPITIAYESNGTVIETIPTRFIEYRPGYNELDQSPTWYDASVLYLDARQEGDGIAVIEDQSLVNDGKVQITALQNEFRRSGTGRVTVELRPAESITGDIPEGDLNVTIPTRLSDEEYWNGTDISSDIYSITDDENGDNVHNLTLETTTTNLTVDTVGVQEAPEEPSQNDNARLGGGGSDSSGESPVGLVYNNDAIAIDGNDDPSPDRSGGVEFSVTNQYEQPVTITSMTIDPDSPDINELDDAVPNDFTGNRDPSADEVEIWTENSSGSIQYSEWTTSFGDSEALAIDDQVTISPGTDGDANSDTLSRIQSGQQLGLSMYEFYEEGGRGFPYDQNNNINMSGEQLTITLVYEFDDGTADSTTYQMTPS